LFDTFHGNDKGGIKMADNQKLDMDMLFSGANAALNAAQNTIGAVTAGINDVRQFMGDSRRNVPNQPQMGGGYAQPVTYGYGYGDSGPYQTQNPYSTYGGYNSHGSGFFMNNRMNNYGGYEGFTNPGYGTATGMGVMPSMPNRPQGGAWG